MPGIVPQLEYVLRILGAVLCGAALGIERERRVKSAGIKTHMIVSAGAAIMMVLSKYAYWDVLTASGDVKLDPSRMAAGIVTAVGFLGAGVIFTRGFKINGVTTAAGIWATVGIGMAIGGGMYIVGVAGTIIILLVQLLVHRLPSSALRSPVNASVRAMGQEKALREVHAYLRKCGGSTLKFVLIPMDEDGMMEMDLHIVLPSHRYEAAVFDLLQWKSVKILSVDVEP